MESTALFASKEQPKERVLLLTPRPESVERFLTLMPDIALVPVQDVDGTQLRDRVTDAFMACQPDIIVIDSRTALDLSSLCRLLREYPAGRECHLSIMTHSAKDWVMCMNLDVDDIVYIDPEENFLTSFATVMARYMRALAQRQMLVEKSRQVHCAITTAAEYGALLHFMDAAEKRADLLGLAELVLRNLAGRSLEAVVHIAANDEALVYPTENVPTMHSNIVRKLAASEARIVQLDRFLGFRYGVFSLLVVNAPFSDTVEYGRLKDYIAHLCAIAESRAKGIIVKESIGQHHQQLQEVLGVLRDVTRGFNDYTQKIMQEMSLSLEKYAVTFDLQANEEDQLLAIAMQTGEKLDALLDNHDIVEKHFLNVITTMSKLKALIDLPGQGNDELAGDAVEIF